MRWNVLRAHDRARQYIILNMYFVYIHTTLRITVRKLQTCNDARSRVSCTTRHKCYTRFMRKEKPQACTNTNGCWQSLRSKTINGVYIIYHRRPNACIWHNSVRLMIINLMRSICAIAALRRLHQFGGAESGGPKSAHVLQAVNERGNWVGKDMRPLCTDI